MPSRRCDMSASDSDSDVAQIPEELPPVQPPSAGFIVQLFVVPGVIVAGIIGVWLLFGKLAGGDYDWRGLVVELQHPNSQRRWRGALGLAQILTADQKRGDAGQHLATNRELAQALNDTLAGELKRGGQSDEDFEYQAYLARTLGLFDLPEVVFPALQQAMRSEVDRDVRKNAISSIAVMTFRMTEAERGSSHAPFAQELTAVSTDHDPLIRQMSAYTLGFFPEKTAQDRLSVLLDDTDADVRINAAIALMRQGNTGGFGVFREVLQRPPAGQAPEGSADEYEQFVALKNCLDAIQRLATDFTPTQRLELIPLIESVAADHREPKIRIAAQSALSVLRANEHPAQ